MGALVRVMVVLQRGQCGYERWGLNGCIEKDPWGHWSGSMRVFIKGQWGRRSTFRVVSSTLQGCKLYLAGLQALPSRVVSSTLQGCKLYLTGLQALPYRVASSTLQGCKLYLTGL